MILEYESKMNLYLYHIDPTVLPERHLRQTLHCPQLTRGLGWEQRVFYIQQTKWRRQNVQFSVARRPLLVKTEQWTVCPPSLSSPLLQKG